MKRQMQVMQGPFESEIAASCCFQRGRKVRWLLIAKADRNRVCEAAYSDNEGRTWHLVEIGSVKGEGPMSGGSLSQIASDRIYFATNKRNVYVSQDGGKTWQLEAKITR